MQSVFQENLKAEDKRIILVEGGKTEEPYGIVRYNNAIANLPYNLAWRMQQLLRLEKSNYLTPVKFMNCHRTIAFLGGMTSDVRQKNIPPNHWYVNQIKPLSERYYVFTGVGNFINHLQSMSSYGNKKIFVVQLFNEVFQWTLHSFLVFQGKDGQWLIFHKKGAKDKQGYDLFTANELKKKIFDDYCLISDEYLTDQDIVNLTSLKYSFLHWESFVKKQTAGFIYQLNSEEQKKRKKIFQQHIRTLQKMGIIVRIEN